MTATRLYLHGDGVYRAYPEVMVTTRTRADAQAEYDAASLKVKNDPPEGDTHEKAAPGTSPTDSGGEPLL